jgi:Tfp pilus assembly protein PilF
MADAAPAGGMPAAPAAEESDGHPDLPLRKNGLNSAAELARALASSGSEEARRHLEAGFRRAFTTRREARDYRIAEEELRKAIEIDPTYAEAYRALAYAVFNTGLDFDGAIKLYEQAVSLKPDYGEAHYALAFMLGGRDPKTGREHFEKAMALGVKDERGLREKFYAGQ